MFVHPKSRYCGKLEEDFKPVESIMRCEDFKSNFARRLSNRYISRPISSPRQDTLKLQLERKEAPENVKEKIEICASLSSTTSLEHNVESARLPDKMKDHQSKLHNTEVTALNMKVQTLRWQLSQTEANRQMHIELLKQIVSFLSRVKEHIDNQKSEDGDEMKKEKTPRVPRSFNMADLPRSRSVLHVSKNLEYTMSPVKKLSARKISKSISNVNGLKDYSGLWNQSKLSLVPETEHSKKIVEEISRLITLANTVLSTKLPDLACACYDSNKSDITLLLNDQEIKTDEKPNDMISDVNSQNKIIIEQLHQDEFIPFTENVTYNETNFADVKISEIENASLTDYDIDSGSPVSLPCGLDSNLAGIHITAKDTNNPHNKKNNVSITNLTRSPIRISKRNEYNHDDHHVSNFIEDESGFSSMSSFQELGIPIISIIPPSPCKEMGYIDELPDVLEEIDKWKTDAIEFDKQAVKVFWV